MSRPVSQDKIVASDFGAGQDCLAPGYNFCYSYNYWNSYNYSNSLVPPKQLEQNHAVLMSATDTSTNSRSAHSGAWYEAAAASLGKKNLGLL